MKQNKCPYCGFTTGTSLSHINHCPLKPENFEQIKEYLLLQVLNNTRISRVSYNDWAREHKLPVAVSLQNLLINNNIVDEEDVSIGLVFIYLIILAYQNGLIGEELELLDLLIARQTYDLCCMTVGEYCERLNMLHEKRGILQNDAQILDNYRNLAITILEKE